MDCSPLGSSVYGDSPGKKTGMGYYAPLQGIVPTQGSNPRLLCLLNWQAGSLPVEPPGKPMYMYMYISIVNVYVYTCSISLEKPD